MSEKQKSLLVVSCEAKLTNEQRAWLADHVNGFAESIGMVGMVLEQGMTHEVHHDLSGLIDAIQQQTGVLAQIANQNQVLISALLEDEVDEGDMPASSYLDGSPIQ